ncbi:P-loop containing nucleoside triphosphate hydrolase protein [Fennellomyces sp. T-0311]|nr:P-loop containing nucleoside triphosphate hydrolase protein [Fennellomyces sp. T-0311]
MSKTVESHVPTDPGELSCASSPPFMLFNGGALYTTKLARLSNGRKHIASIRLFDQAPQRSVRKRFRRRPNSRATDQTPAVKIVLNPDRKEVEHVYVPSALAKHLKEHQIEGVRFMWRHIIEQNQGCVLAHSMGLGKSLQTVTFVATLLDAISKNYSTVPHSLKSKRILLVAPLTTLSHWVFEFDKWAQGAAGNIYNYADTAATSAPSRIKYLKHWYQDGGVLLMSYEQYRNLVFKDTDDQQILHTMLVNPGPSLVITDEAHRIKNSTSLVALAMKQVNTRARICLSGSPLQNNLREFYCVLDFACPGYLPPEDEFRYMYMTPIQNIFADSSPSDIYIAKKQLLKLQLLTADVVLRRDATLLSKELPRKTEYYVACKLTSMQYEVYNALLEYFRQSDMRESALINLLLLRAVCNHPSILNQMTLERQARQMEQTQKNPSIEESDIPLDEEMMELTALKNKQLVALPQKLCGPISSDSSDVGDSCKMSLVIAIALKCRDICDKLIIVSHSILCLDYLENLLATLQFATVRLDGSTPHAERHTIIDTFNTDATKHIMLLSARAGSLGVNITGANRMIICDSDWNPQHDEQSVGRVYRYGQTKDVFIYRLHTYTTIEHRLLYQSIHKRGLASRVIDNEQLSAQDKREMRKYYAVPIQYPETQIPNVTDAVLQQTMEEQADGVVDAALKESLDQGDMLPQIELEKEDIEKVRREVLGYKQRYILQRQQANN